MDKAGRKATAHKQMNSNFKLPPKKGNPGQHFGETTRTQQIYLLITWDLIEL